MKNFLTKLVSTLIYILSIVVVVKLLWLIVNILFLPTSGEEHREEAKLKPLYYRAKLANRVPTPPPVKRTPKKVKKPKVVISMKGIKLLALYNSKDNLVVTVEKSRKSYILSKGENIDGFVLKSAGNSYAIFTKGDKEFKLSLDDGKIKNPSSIRVVKPPKAEKPKERDNPKSDKVEHKIVENEDGEGKVISKGLLTSYTQDIDKIWKDIGIGEHKKNGVLDGFIVNFVRKGSDFEQLGLKKGDILKSINGQELDSYNSAFSFYKEIGDIDSLTLGIIRNNQEMELEYEIH